MALALVGIAIATILLFWYLTKKRKPPNGWKELPGPSGLPIIGNAHQVGKHPNVTFTKWSKEFGGIYKMKLASYEMVIVSDPKLSKEMFAGDPAFASKPYFPGFDVYEDGPKLGIINSDGEMWEVHRRFLLRQLRDFGFGKTAMETLIVEELDEVLEKLKKFSGKSVTRIKEDYLRLAVVNSLWRIVTGKRMAQDDPKLIKLSITSTQSFNDIIEKSGFLLLSMPWLQKVIPEYSGFNAVRRMMNQIQTTFEGTLNEHKETYEEDNPRDFIDVYLAEMKKAKDPSNMFYGTKAEKYLVSTLFDLFLAGSETTSTTLDWTILYLSQDQSIQKKLQQEIFDVTGDTRKVSVTDRPNMPYTCALIDEILRHASIAPDGVTHMAAADREFHGYHIPKGAWLQPNIYYIHHDPKTWGDPENLRPERFLSADGKKYKKSENFQGFQVGRRQCAGETLARDTIFLYITHIFQQFSITPDTNYPEPTLEPKVGFVRTPQQFHVIMKDRLAK